MGRQGGGGSAPSGVRYAYNAGANVGGSSRTSTTTRMSATAERKRQRVPTSTSRGMVRGGEEGSWGCGATLVCLV